MFQSWLEQVERDVAAAERRRIIALLLEDCTCQKDRGELVEECKAHELVRIIMEHSNE
jgi:hypothetical protein